MNPSRISEKYGQALFDAERERRTLPPLISEEPDLDAAGAYAIQEAYAGLRVDGGATLVGRKIGATSKAIQELFGIDTPDFGHIFDDMVIADGGDVVRAELIQPMVEPELAFILHRDMAGPGVTADDVLAATQAVIPCLEIIDSRIVDWQISFADTVADNGSSARAIFADQRVTADGLDLAAVVATMTHNGAVVAEAPGSAVLGHPAASVAWLANALGDFGHTLRAGEYVLSGSFMTAVRAEAGDSFEATFSGVGSVSCRFV